MKDQFSASGIGITFLSGLGCFQCIPDLLHLSFGFSQNLRSKYLAFSSLIPEQRCSTLASIQSLKWWHLQTGLIAVIIGELSVWQILVPTLTILQCTSSQHILENLVHPFSLAIGLGMVS